MSQQNSSSKRFWLRNPEKADLNQYWYSEGTLQALVQELVMSGCQHVAFLSTPSVFFSLPEDTPPRLGSFLFDLDEKWSGLPAFVRYDFNDPTGFTGVDAGSCDGFVIDPPFITQEVWEKYAETVRHLATRDPDTQKISAKIVASTIPENAPFMEELLGVRACPFKPSIPHLVYQYCFYTNYQPSEQALGCPNPEIPDEEED